ncbi:Fe(3+) ABC transporter substrate-binding protein [uncultured Algimonas sp.]|uniref:Fe(3+) ABC transporter substrate-binding protein n=1 Tax=uncultured Algimonas sp. TaxID=1547920 RepID=UPI00261DD27C|nr:Fe(3+) ABC transporter substrate-binding protein [uncultured Algimonas sp.]
MRFAACFLIATALTACSPSADSPSTDLSVVAAVAPGAETLTAPSDAGTVNLYTSRHYDTDLALYDDFTKETGIKVNRIEADASSLIERIASEGEFSPADLLITVDAGNLWRAEEAGVLSSVDSEILRERVPDYLRDDDGHWFGLSTRARVIIYNKEDGLPAGLTDYEDLADPAHAGQVCMRSSGNIYNISLLSSVIEHAGSEVAEDWARGVVANFARRPQSNDTGQIEAVASGECGISVVNTYYLARYARSEDKRLNDIVDAVGIVFPNQDGRGTHVNISGAGVTAHAPNRDNAVRFLEYLTEASAQEYFANGNNEYPVVAGMSGNSDVQALGGFTPDSLKVSTFGPNQSEAVRIFDRVGWQ